ncbi:MAG: hypothetical protein JO126_00480 [Alphaproteobacteria bacterium]|nr:hypothetical protein [Alphaproteobacteria bacterium]MBV8547915.1 hypothetical protein [Alphaproteobacteria bacterium]
MADTHHTPATVSPAMVQEHRAGWNCFTKAIVITCVSMAGFLLAMLLVFKVF